jgi:hypothetical protein
MGHQLNLSFSNFRNRIAASLQCTNSLGHINKKKKTNFLFLFLFFQKKSCFSMFGIIMFSVIYRHVVYGLWSFAKIRGTKEYSFMIFFFLAKLQKRKLEFFYSKFELWFYFGSILNS